MLFHFSGGKIIRRNLGLPDKFSVICTVVRSIPFYPHTSPNPAEEFCKEMPAKSSPRNIFQTT